MFNPSILEKAGFKVSNQKLQETKFELLNPDRAAQYFNKDNEYES